MSSVLFKLLTRAQYDAITTPDAGTLYRVQEVGGGESFYQGTNKLDRNDLDAAEFALASVVNNVVNIKSIKEEDGVISVGTGAGINLEEVAYTGAASDVSVADAGGLLTATNVEDALAELATASAGGVDSKTIWVNPNEGVTTGYLKTYGIYQGANSYDAITNPATLIGKIDIPKDLVVTSGSVGTVTTADDPYEGAVVGDKYIDLAIANQTEHIYIPATSLVDIYTTQASATQVQLAINSNNVISATIVAGSIGTTELSSGVNASLALAESAVQSVTASNPTTGTNGTFEVDGVEVAIKGLGTAAFADTTAFDAAGTAAALASSLAAVATSGAAEDVSYDNTTSGLTADDVQAAIDEIAGTAGSAIQSITEGATNGTIAVDGTDVAVHGLGSAAFENTTAFDPAGSSAAVLGSNTDDEDDITVYGARAYADAQIAAALEWETIS